MVSGQEVGARFVLRVAGESAFCWDTWLLGWVAAGAGSSYRGVCWPSGWLSGCAGTGRATLECPAGAVGAFRRRLGRVFRPVLKVRAVGLRLMGVDFPGKWLG